MPEEDLIVGSGPAGVAVAHALLARGRNVRMLDVGVELEADHAARAARMGASAPGDWSRDDLEAVRGPRRQTRTEAMLPYGSDFPVRDVVSFFGPEGPPSGIALRPSFARGGLSNGWGASVAPYRQEDLSAWPASARALGAHYKAVSDFMPIAAKCDGLMDALPQWRPEQDTALAPSPQGAEALRRLYKRQHALARAGVYVGQARNAVAPGCRACAMCLYGCPYKLIFNAAHALDGLRAREGFAYESGLRVERFCEDAGAVTLYARDCASGAGVERKGARAFIAAGVLPSADIVLASIGAPGDALMLADSQQALMPMLHAWKAPGADVARAPQHVLAQMFIEIIDARVSPRSVHAQCYTYSELFAPDLRPRFAWAGALGEAVTQALARRLIVAQAFLHSDHSARIRLTREKGRLHFAAETNSDTAPMLARALSKIAAVMAPAGVIALPFMARVGAPGSSFHCGASLPMRDAPGRLETDIFGRPAGLARVHVVDASVLPSIPATTITFSVMANAHRIGATAPL